MGDDFKGAVPGKLDGGLEVGDGVGDGVLAEGDVVGTAKGVV